MSAATLKVLAGNFPPAFSNSQRVLFPVTVIVPSGPTETINSLGAKAMLITKGSIRTGSQIFPLADESQPLPNLTKALTLVYWVALSHEVLTRKVPAVLRQTVKKRYSRGVSILASQRGLEPLKQYQNCCFKPTSTAGHTSNKVAWVWPAGTGTGVGKLVLPQVAESAIARERQRPSRTSAETLFISYQYKPAKAAELQFYRKNRNPLTFIQKCSTKSSHQNPIHSQRIPFFFFEKHSFLQLCVSSITQQMQKYMMPSKQKHIIIVSIQSSLSFHAECKDKRAAILINDLG